MTVDPFDDDAGGVSVAWSSSPRLQSCVMRAARHNLLDDPALAHQQVVLEAMLAAITAILVSAGFTVRDSLNDYAPFTLEVLAGPGGPRRGDCVRKRWLWRAGRPVPAGHQPMDPNPDQAEVPGCRLCCSPGLVGSGVVVLDLVGQGTAGALSRWLTGWEDPRADHGGGGRPWRACRRRTRGTGIRSR